MTNLRTDGLQIICPDGPKAAETILTSIAMYRQCEDLEDSSSLLLNIDFDDMVTGSGVKFAANRTYTDINTSGSVVAIEKMFAGMAISYDVQVQRDAFSRKLDQLIEGAEYMPYDERAGWEVLLLGDKPGQYVPSVSALISYYRNGEPDPFCQDWAPNSQIMSSQDGTMSAGQTYSRTLQVMPMPIPGDPALTRVKRLRKIGSYI